MKNYFNQMKQQRELFKFAELTIEKKFSLKIYNFFVISKFLRPFNAQHTVVGKN